MARGKAEPAATPALDKVEAAMAAVREKYGRAAVMRLREDEIQKVPTTPTGSIALDRALGCGGWPRGRIIELFGHESGGKTTLSLHAMAEAQKLGGTVAFVDAEHAFDPTYAAAVGVRVKDMLLSQPDHGEQALEIVEDLVDTGAVSLIVIDSVAALTPKAEVDGEMGDSHMGLQARMMSQAMRKLTAKAHRNNTTLIFINQIRMKIGIVFGNPETTTGGAALKFYASVRCDVRRRDALKRAGEELPVGNTHTAKVIKNKLAPPFRAAEFDIIYGMGVDTFSDLLTVAVADGVFDVSGAWYSYKGERLCQGRGNLRERLASDEKLRDEVFAAVTKRP